MFSISLCSHVLVLILQAIAWTKNTSKIYIYIHYCVYTIWIKKRLCRQHTKRLRNRVTVTKTVNSDKQDSKRCFNQDMCYDNQIKNLHPLDYRCRIANNHLFCVDQAAFVTPSLKNCQKLSDSYPQFFRALYSLCFCWGFAGHPEGFYIYN